MTATVATLVWYHPPGSTASDSPQAGIIACVREDGSVNLAIFDENGIAYSATKVYLYSGTGTRPADSYCEWIPAPTTPTTSTS